MAESTAPQVSDGRPPWRPWRTVRFRVTAVALGAVLVLLAVTAAVLLATVRSQLTDQLDDELTARAEQLGELAAAGSLPTALTDPGDEVRVQVLAADGRVVLQSDELDDDDPEDRILLVPPRPVEGGSAGGTSSDDTDDDDDDPELTVEVATLVPAGDDDAVRVASVAVGTPDGPLTIAVARSVVDLEAQVESLTRTLALAVPIVAVALAAVTWWLVGRTLGPVDAIRRQVAGIDATELDRRVPEPGTGDEIDRLARTMNAMLERLDAGATREQRFVSDASHELRSPLTRMRLGLEVELAHPDAQDATTTRRELLADVVGMERLVDELLQLAHLDRDGAQAALELVDLDDVVLAQVDALQPSADVRIDLSGVGAAQLLGDPRAVARVVRNLLENAQRHARSLVAVTLVDAPGEVVLTVGDDGPGIAPADRERVFDRFVRLDEARSADDGGAGLGLAITRAVVERHGGAILVEDAPGGGAAFRVSLPRRPPA